MKKLSDNKSEKKRFKIPNRFVSSPKRKERNEIKIIPPNICPICGKTNVDEKYKLRSRSYNFRKYITIFMCGTHIQFNEKTKFLRLLNFISIFTILLIISLLLLNIISSSFTGPIIYLIIPIICALFSFNIIKGGFKLTWIQDLEKKYVNFKFYRKYSIISIRRLDWANEFKNLNQTSEYKLDLELIEELKKKRNRSAIYIGIMATICIPGIIFSFLLLGLGIIPYIIAYFIGYFLYFLLIGATIFFVIKLAYYTMETLDMEDLI
ncbi:MAG: hypothetical protein EU529_03510 [Promethearchaeota archaeon]|nr:MAG: hypothetical protein EU529_03510 [Candidatus Lokiarchaeota archaeon]